MPLPRHTSADPEQWGKVLQRRKEAADLQYATSQRITVNNVAFQLGKLLGAGTFGKVYEAFDISSGQMMAVKVVPTGKAGESLMKQLECEIHLLENMRHINIVNQLGAMMNGSDLNILMEYVDGNSIDHILGSIGPLHETIIRRYIKQLLQALLYCHERNVLHRDIKGKNILVNSKGVVKLADFGSAKVVQDLAEKDNPSAGFSYTPLWVAPEVMSGKYNAKVDIWSMGCVVIEMASAKPPWDECGFQTSFEALYHIGSTNSLPAIPPHLSEEAKSFILTCLTRDPAKRPSARDLLKHPFIVNADKYIASVVGQIDPSSLPTSGQVTPSSAQTSSGSSSGAPVLPARPKRPAYGTTDPVGNTHTTG